MIRPSQIFVLTPAYNEAKALGELLPDITLHLKPLGLPFTLCVVDDGSTDGTEEAARRGAAGTSLQYLRHEKNQGYGATLRTGILWVIQHAQPEDIVVTLDADNTHSPSYIPALIHKLEEGNGVVTASYTVHGGAARGVPFQRRVLSRGANMLLKLRFRLPGVGTYTNGFRAYRVLALRDARTRHGERLIEENDFAGGTELFIKVVHAGAKVGEVPFELRYDRRGTSKMRLFKTIRGYLKLLQWRADS